MTAEELSAIAGVVLSLVFSYVPGVAGWYEKLQADWKRVLMAVLLLAVAGAISGLSCGGVIDAVECSQAGALGLVKILIAALVANQGTYLISPKK
jgi:hypothetical protein